MRSSSALVWCVWFVAAWIISDPLAAQTPTSLPEGLTPSMVSEGETYFKSVGLCFACHGMDAKGIPGVGANLTDDEWYHGDGTFGALVDQILQGVPPELSRSGVMMPPKGGSQITEAQARAIAGYVWALSHRSELIDPAVGLG